MWTPIVGKLFQQPNEVRAHLVSLDFKFWKPSLVVWHNTAAPTGAQWQTTETSDRAKGLAPGITRIRNLENYFKNDRGWPSGPHWFVTAIGWWAFTPSNRKGTHSPSWNGRSIGIEMVADFDKEQDNSGYGLKVRQNTVALTAILCEVLGVKPEIGEVLSKRPLKTSGAIFLHKQDPATTHDCPGRYIAEDHEDMVQEVREYMGHAGNHHVEESAVKWTGTVLTPGDTLNMRERSSAASHVIASLKDGTALEIRNDAMNGKTRWLFVTAGTAIGWVSARYVKETKS